MAEIFFTLYTEFIELYKLLKAASLCESGGAAKYAVSQGEVKIDGQIETRKAHKVFKGQRVEFGAQTIFVK